VVSSVPETVRTLARTSRDGAPPVPTISREVRSRSPRCHGELGHPALGHGGLGDEGTLPFGLLIFLLSSLDGGDDLDHGSVGERGIRPGAAGDDLAVDSDGDPLHGRDELGHEVREGRAGQNLARIPVDGEGHRNLPG
jgi:hypothetical protein